MAGGQGPPGRWGGCLACAGRVWVVGAWRHRAGGQPGAFCTALVLSATRGPDPLLPGKQVLAALVPLLERRTLNIAARAESVAAAPGFQLIATVTSAPGAGRRGGSGSRGLHAAMPGPSP